MLDCQPPRVVGFGPDDVLQGVVDGAVCAGCGGVEQIGFENLSVGPIIVERLLLHPFLPESLGVPSQIQT
jgi:hypothetical protein